MTQTLQQRTERAKREILDDILIGTVPVTVTNYDLPVLLAELETL